MRYRQLFFARHRRHYADNGLGFLLVIAGLAYGGAWLVRHHGAVLWPIAVVVGSLVVSFRGGRWLWARRAAGRAQSIANELSSDVVACFRIEPCVTCYEGTFWVVKFNSLGRALQYECAGCAKRRWAPALVPGTGALAERDKVRQRLVARCARLRHDPTFAVPIVGAVPPAPLPFEAARREHIPADLRRYVLERDGGRCQDCGANSDLQIDHIVAVARGGATTMANLQTLCGYCNRQKGSGS
jgi:hypothetical protein